MSLSGARSILASGEHLPAYSLYFFPKMLPSDSPLLYAGYLSEETVGYDGYGELLLCRKTNQSQ